MRNPLSPVKQCEDNSSAIALESKSNTTGEESHANSRGSGTQEPEQDMHTRKAAYAGMPNSEECGRHCVLHGEYRSLYPACVADRGRSRQHPIVDGREDGLPIAGMYFASVGTGIHNAG